MIGWLVKAVLSGIFAFLSALCGLIAWSTPDPGNKGPAAFFALAFVALAVAVPLVFRDTRNSDGTGDETDDGTNE